MKKQFFLFNGALAALIVSLSTVLLLPVFYSGCAPRAYVQAAYGKQYSQEDLDKLVGKTKQEVSEIMGKSYNAQFTQENGERVEMWYYAFIPQQIVRHGSSGIHEAYLIYFNKGEVVTRACRQ
jgi:outer membrane protein assembly factor BamE (lipoprotein component of BamABCDE complex)